MRTESEIKDFIADLEAVLSIPGSVPGEFVLQMHKCMLEWVLGADNATTEARQALKDAMREYGVTR